MVYGHFREKAFTKVSYLELVCLDFEGTELGFCFRKGKLSILCPIFGKVVHISISNVFCSYGFVGCRKKWIFPFYQCAGCPKRMVFVRWLPRGSVQNGTTPIFKGMGP
jgi:hypothetical protein